MSLIPIYRPRSNAEALVIASLMQAHAIRHVMQGGAFSSMVPGPLAVSLNAQILMVESSQEATARELLTGFLGITP